MELKDERIKTYIDGLDPVLEGGIPKNFIVLVCGHAGTMKSSVTYSILYNNAKRENKKGIYLTLEQSKQSIIEHMAKLGMPPTGIENLAVMDLARVRKDIMEKQTEKKNIDWLNSIIGVLKNYKERFGCDILVLDSLAALYALTTFKNPRAELFYFFEKLRDLGVTALLISEIPTDRNVYGLYGIEDFLSDGIIHLKVVQTDAGANLYLGVVKMRKTKHTRDFMPLIAESGRFEVVRD